MKRLVLENREAINNYKLFAKELVTTCNTVLDRFQKSYNVFNQPITESIAQKLICEPIVLFDSLLRANSPIKPIGGKELDITKLAELCGIDRNGWINSCTMVFPGTKSHYNPHGTMAIFQLPGKHKHLVTWKDDKFVLNESELLNDFEMFRVYATTKEQNDLIDRWEALAEALNKHRNFIQMDNIDSNRIAHMVHLDFDNGKFLPKYSDLADQIKAMAVN